MRIITALFLILTATPALADPIIGLWKTDTGENGTAGLVEVSACGPRFCAAIKGAADGQGDPALAHLLGRRVFWDMAPLGGGIYEGGRIWSPKRDKEYDGRLTLSGDKLVIEGCLMSICQVGGRWTRTD